MTQHSRRASRRAFNSFGRAVFDTLEQRRLLSTAVGPLPQTVQANTIIGTGTRQMEYLNRGVVALRSYDGVNNVYSAFISWRLLGTDPAGSATGFNIYRSINGGAPTKLNTLVSITNRTNFTSTISNPADTYTYIVKAVINGVEETTGESATIAPGTVAQEYLSVPLQIPAGGTTPAGEAYTYVANDASVGDVDGDGQYEIILKWDPTNAKDNSQSGYTGNVYLDAYKLDGTRLWRIDLGRNIRAGAHYTQFQVYDFDGDGRAEVACKTAPGTKDGLGNWVLRPGDDPNADYRNTSGYVLSGPEYLTVFSGFTGAALDTESYVVPRGTVSAWGDNYGNRVDRFLAATAYLDGVRPSIIMARGYYTRSTITAWDFRNGQLTQRWLFDSNVSGSQYTGQGNHNLSIADVDADGKDEIIYGSMAVNDNGAPMYSTGLGHGDALHVSDMDTSRPGQEVWGIHEGGSRPGSALYDAATGQVIFQTPNADVGRGVAADVYAGNPGYEMWGGGGLFNSSGATIARAPSTSNFLVWWDADFVRELLDGQSSGTGAPRIDKYGTSSDTRLLTMTGALTNNGTKATPALSGDILGDWREEVVVRASDNSHLRIYTTKTPSTTRIYTLMHDPQYRVAIAWQNTAYNQPPHPSFFLGDGMATPPTPNIHLVKYDDGPEAPTGLSAWAGGLNEIEMSWIPVAEATSYKVKRATSAGGPFTTIASNILTTNFTDNTVTNGTTYYYVVSGVNAEAAEGVDSSSATGMVPVPSASSTIYPAESASFGDGVTIDSNNAGFNGTGFANFPGSSTTGFLQFDNVDGGSGGSVAIRFRHALGAGAARSGSLIVNGVSQGITFGPTGAWTTWELQTLSVNLNPGPTNTIRLQVTGNDLTNIDELHVVGADTTGPTISPSTHSWNPSPNQLNFTFSEAVDPSISKNDLVVTLLGPNTSITPTAFGYDANTRTATYTLPISLPDGNYRATFTSGGVIDTKGNPLSSTFYFDFFVYTGDVNHDRTVNVLDMLIVANNWFGTGKTYDQGDVNRDGTVDAADLGIIGLKWLGYLEPAPPPAPPPPPQMNASTSVSTSILKPESTTTPIKTVVLTRVPPKPVSTTSLTRVSLR